MTTLGATLSTTTFPSGSGGDLLSTLVNSEISITGAVTATISTMHVISGTSASYTITLPATSGNTGKLIGFRVAALASASKLYTLDGNTSETINGALTRVMWAGEAAILLCDGSNWFKIAGLSIPMSANLSLTGGPQNYTGNTYTVVLLNNIVSDNTNLIADTTNHRLNVQRTSAYSCIGFITYDPANNAGGAWLGTSGAEVDVLNNAGAGGTVWTTSKGTLVNASFIDVVPVATGVFTLTAGQYVALQGYAGGTAGNFNDGTSGTGCGLGITEVCSW